MKILASDFDGTIYLHTKDHEGFVDDDLEMIEQFQEKGNLFGVCTGRGVEGIIRPTLGKIKYDFYICSSGAVILNQDLNVIFKKEIPYTLVKDIAAYIGNDTDMNFRYNGNMYHINRSKASMGGSERIYIDSLEDVKANYVTNFSMHFLTPEIAKEVSNKVKEKFGNEIDVYQNITHLDYAPKGCSKGNGLKIIKEYYNIKDEDLNVIGDSWNDIPMFQACKNSYTFITSPVDVKKETKYQVESVKQCLEQILNS